MPLLNIVGQKFRGLDPYLPGILAGVDALLVREPDNEHDAFAVAVWINGRHVGYLRKQDNESIAKRIDAESKTFGQACTDAGLTFDAALQIGDRKVLRAKFTRSQSSSYPQVLIED